MRIREVQPSDRAEWLRMLLELYGDSNAADHAAEVDAFLSGAPLPGVLLPAAVFMCERDEVGLAGFLELSLRNYGEGCGSPVPYVESWYVDAELRGRGVGRALMSAAEQWARDEGYTEMASDATLSNERSHRAHRSLGFEETERVVTFRKVL